LLLSHPAKIILYISIFKRYNGYLIGNDRRYASRVTALCLTVFGPGFWPMQLQELNTKETH